MTQALPRPPFASWSSPSATLSAALCVVALGALTGCGYRFGHHADPTIRTVAVPVFESVADRTGWEIQLTEAVQKEIQSRTPFRLVHAPQADTVLRGRVVTITKQPLTQTLTDDPRELQFTLAVEITWEDRRGNELSGGSLPISSEAVAALSTGAMAVEVGQSRATAQRQAVQRLARQVVDLMEVPW